MSVETFIDSEYAALLSHPIVVSVDVVRFDVDHLDGYLRVRCRLSNGDRLEATMHVTRHAGEVLIDDYRYQWLDAGSVFIRRWDSSPHHPELPGFPHHCHVGGGNLVEPAAPMRLSEVIELVAALIGKSSW